MGAAPGGRLKPKIAVTALPFASRPVLRLSERAPRHSGHPAGEV